MVRTPFNVYFALGWFYSPLSSFPNWCRHFFSFHFKIFVQSLLGQFSYARKLAKNSWKTRVEKVSNPCPLAFYPVKVTASSSFPWGFSWKTAHTSFPCYLCCNLLATSVKCLWLYTIQNFTSKVEFSHFHRSLIQNSAFPIPYKTSLAPTFL